MARGARARGGAGLDADVEVVVVGAGAAGLSCARGLVGAGVRVRVLEGRARPFGRVHTLRPSGWPCAVEAGAELVHGRPREAIALSEEAGVGLVPMGDRHLVRAGAHLSDDDARFAAAAALTERGPPAGVPDEAIAAAIARAERAGDPAGRLARAYVEGFHAADPARASRAALALQARRATLDDGDTTLRVPDGYDRLLAPLVPRGALWLGVLVDELRWRAGRVEVRARGLLGDRLPPIVARAAVVTAPASLVAQGRPRMVPTVAAWRDAARALPLGRVVKLLVRLRERLWPRGATFLHDAGAAVPTWWTVDADGAVLVGCAGGRAAEALARTARDDGPGLVRRAAASLARTLGIAPARLRDAIEGAIVADWGRDPLARGAYSWVPVGALDAQRALATPVDETLFYAGEAAEDEGASGTVHGALRSGARAAAALLAVLRVKQEPPRAEAPLLGH